MRKMKFAMVSALGLTAIMPTRVDWAHIYLKPIEPWKSKRKGGKSRRAK